MEILRYIQIYNKYFYQPIHMSSMQYDINF